MSSRNAFTLVELLVVIAILLILMGMIMGGVMVAKDHAMKVKATSAVNQLAAAVEQYRSLNNTYPELLKKPDPTSDAAWATAEAADTEGKLAALAVGADVFKEAFTSGAVEDWRLAINAALVYQLGGLASDSAKNGLALDPWNKPLRYRPSKYYPYDTTAGAKLIDSDKPPKPDSFQLWSTGKDMVDQSGEAGSDDVTNWVKP